MEPIDRPLVRSEPATTPPGSGTRAPVLTPTATASAARRATRRAWWRGVVGAGVPPLRYLPTCTRVVRPLLVRRPLSSRPRRSWRKSRGRHVAQDRLLAARTGVATLRAESLWSEVPRHYDRIVCVSGSVLPCWPGRGPAGAAQLRWERLTRRIADRLNGSAEGLPAGDALFDAPICRRLEQRLLRGAHAVARTRWTLAGLAGADRTKVRATIPSPAWVNCLTDLRASPACTAPSDRLLALRRFAQEHAPLLRGGSTVCRESGSDLSAHGRRSADTRAEGGGGAASGVGDAVTFHGKLPEVDLPAFYRSLDVLADPFLPGGLRDRRSVMRPRRQGAPVSTPLRRPRGVRQGRRDRASGRV